MITGDSIQTARSIAIKCGIMKPNDGDNLVLNGKDFNERIRDSSGRVSKRNVEFSISFSFLFRFHKINLMKFGQNYVF